MGLGDPGAGPGGCVWPGFLRGESSQEILAHLSGGDPLRLCESAARRLREVWFLIEPDRVYHRALSVCAEAAAVESPPESLAQWSKEKLDLSIEQLVREDREAEHAHPEKLSAEDMIFPLLTEALFVEPEAVRRCATAFNSLEPLLRRAFFELLIEGREVIDCVEAGPWDEDGLYDAIQGALGVFGLEASATRKGGGKRSEAVEKT